MENFIPKSYKNNIIANKLTWFQNKWITFALTTDNCILEFEKPFGNLEIGIQNLYKLNKIQKPISTNELQFKILHTLQGEILLLLKVFNHLLVIKRVPSSLELIFYEKNIDKFRLSLRSNDLNDVILYYTSINGAIKKTSLCQLCKISTSSSIDSTLIQNYLHKERQVRRSRLDMAQKNRLLKLCRLVEKHKFLPKISRISCDFDVTPLVRFGSIFLRTCNGKLALMIPCLNTSSPVEVVKHVPIEVVKHVPVEIVKHVPLPYPVHHFEKPSFTVLKTEHYHHPLHALKAKLFGAW